MKTYTGTTRKKNYIIPVVHRNILRKIVWLTHKDVRQQCKDSITCTTDLIKTDVIGLEITINAVNKSNIHRTKIEIIIPTEQIITLLGTITIEALTLDNKLIPIIS